MHFFVQQALTEDSLRTRECSVMGLTATTRQVRPFNPAAQIKHSGVSSFQNHVPFPKQPLEDVLNQNKSKNQRKTGCREGRVSTTQDLSRPGRDKSFSCPAVHTRLPRVEASLCSGWFPIKGRTHGSLQRRPFHPVHRAGHLWHSDEDTDP